MADSPGLEKTLAEVRVTVPTEHLDLVTDYITGEICTGIALDDEEPGGLTPILFYSQPTETESQTAMIREFLTRLGPDADRCAITIRKIENVEWEDEYRRSVRAITIPPDIMVRPPWVDAVPDIRYDIMIEPKMAFGTGTHETTRSCLHVIRERFRPGLRFLDLGCGSGILSIMADKLGAAYIKAIDYDLLAVDNSIENFTANNVTTQHDILLGSVEKCDDDQPYDFVCANIIKNAILDMLDRLIELTATPGTLVLSGLLEQDLDDVLDALGLLGVDVTETIEDNEWRTLVIERTD